MHRLWIYTGFLDYNMRFVFAKKSKFANKILTMNIIIGSTEGSIKKGAEFNLEELLNIIKTEFNGSIDDWWNNRFIDIHMDMEIIEEGEYSENLEFFIQDEFGKSHNPFEFLESQINK